ncbi:hypothetical protein K435DRAFT_794635 [Dendrothele bispora CBS 962.96]|uniref:DUF6589 domain-containing protein n=1 Tax=Dendrothele bispora (strain CBS 962.96) TaxID=1314807 RepID=A0A4S8MCN9_DENBC|nr:hypothetical protein K435DRAFT_794635 [Dendrothele bispora CBS 962.96]
MDTQNQEELNIQADSIAAESQILTFNVEPPAPQAQSPSPPSFGSFGAVTTSSYYSLPIPEPKLKRGRGRPRSLTTPPIPVIHPPPGPSDYAIRLPPPLSHPLGPPLSIPSRTASLQSMDPHEKIKNTHFSSSLPSPTTPSTPSLPFQCQIVPNNPITSLVDPEPSTLFPSPVTPSTDCVDSNPLNLISNHSSISNNESIDSVFSHTQRRFRKPAARRLPKDQKLNLAITYLVDKLHYASVAEFFYDFVEPIPPGSSQAFGDWATQIVGNRVYCDMKDLIHPNPNDNEPIFINPRLATSANMRTKAKGVKTVTKDDLLSFKISDRVHFFKGRAPLIWYLTECMAAPRINSVLVTRKRRPPSIIQVAAISSFVLARNQYANGYLAIQFGIWHIACQSHVDVKRISCLMAPGAFDLKDRFLRILRNDRSELTVEKIYDNINWNHISAIQELHVLRVLLQFVPSLNSLEKHVTESFRTTYAIHRMREGRKTKLVPLGTNSEHEIETEGMKCAIHDFLSQSGWQPEYSSKFIAWFGGDGRSVLAMDRAKKYLAQHYDPDDPESDYKILHNLLPTIGLWHTQSTNQNTIAENHFGPAVTDDPSALSRSASCAGFKRPTNFKDCGNYYPLSHCMKTIWETRVLDCWRLEIGLDHPDDIIKHFENLGKQDQLPEYEVLLRHAKNITERYITLESYEQALSPNDSDSSLMPDHHKFPIGTLFESRNSVGRHNSEDDVSMNTTHTFTEGEDFTGDRVLANSILFMWEYSLWVELDYAVPEGDIGRVWEIMKIWVFIFAGSSNSNYRDLLLDMYCLFRYESSKDLKDAIWNNWLVNVEGELGNWMADDLLQEHYNRWFEANLQKSNSNFDDKFLRKVLSPNVEFFLRLKEEFESALGLHQRSKSHTSPHLRHEYRQLLTLYREEQLHIFCSRRSMGHAATNLFDKGIQQLKFSSLAAFLDKHTDLIENLQEIRIHSQCTQATGSPNINESLTPSPIQPVHDSIHIPIPSNPDDSATLEGSTDGDDNSSSDDSQSDFDEAAGTKEDETNLYKFKTSTGCLSDDWMDDA